MIRSRRIRLGLAFGAGLLASTLGSTRSHAIERVQPYELKTPDKASLAGAFGGVSFGAEAMSRGSLTLKMPFDAPATRGQLQADVFPHYSPDAGMSPWGMGQDVNLSIRRWRVMGYPKFDGTDDLQSPFGRLVKGADGNYYPLGMSSRVRVVLDEAHNTLSAYMPDGSLQVYGGSAVIANGRGAGTYAWFLDHVTDPMGHTTQLAWAANASGYLFLQSVSYGGVGTAFQHRIVLTYESVTSTGADHTAKARFADYLSGKRVELDRRVKTVSAQTKDASSGTLAEVWHYTLSYTADPVGAAFYLSQIDKTFAAGGAAPSAKFMYQLRGEAFSGPGSASFVPDAALTSLLRTLPSSALGPGSALADFDQNGNIDFEVATGERRLVTQLGSDPNTVSFTVSSPLPANTLRACSSAGDINCYDAACRPQGAKVTDMAPVRTFAPMMKADDTINVVQRQYAYSTTNPTTAVTVCTRDGTRLARPVVPGKWDSASDGNGQLVRMVDLNRDHAADLLKIDQSQYSVLPNVSSGGTYGFASAPITGQLRGPSGEFVYPVSTWVGEANGDGLPDIYGQLPDSLLVWHGVGEFAFETNAQRYDFVMTNGSLIPGGSLDPSDPSSYAVVPADFNKDGLTDFILTGNNSLLYFTNDGAKLQQTTIDAFSNFNSPAPPIVGAFDGSGDPSVTYISSGTAYNYKLETPYDGLLVRADDGEGTVLSFDYIRGLAVSSIRQRAVVLSKMSVQSSGYDPGGASMVYQYNYSDPKVHTQGHFFLGYDDVVRQDPRLTQEVHFLNSDLFTGVFLDSSEIDLRAPGLKKIAGKTYGDAAFQGIAYKQLATESSGWQSADGSTSSLVTTTTSDYSADFCPHTQTKVTPHGTLTTVTTRADIPALANSLHCLESDVTTKGTHADSSLDFNQEQNVTRNAFGQVTSLTNVDPVSGKSVKAQAITYDATTHLMTEIDTPLPPDEAGNPRVSATVFGIDANTMLLKSVTNPDGSVLSVGRDPVTDHPVMLVTDRGGGNSYQQSFRDDGLLRLAKTWSSLGVGSEAQPDVAYRYRYATATQPAAVSIDTFVDAPTATFAHAIEATTAKGEPLGKARQLPDGTWALEAVTVRSATAGTSTQYMRDSAPDFLALDYANLVRGAYMLSSETDSTFDFKSTISKMLPGDAAPVANQVDTAFAFAGGALSQSKTEHAEGGRLLSSKVTLDPDKNVTSYTDAAGTTYGYVYDALGRLRVLVLPDVAPGGGGAHLTHRVDFDGLGRKASVRRDGIATISQNYYDGTELVQKQLFSAPDGSAVRSVSYVYENAGRPKTTTQVDEVTHASHAFTFYYDGATPANPSAANQKGLQTAVTGDGGATFTKTFSFRADGKLLERVITLPNWRSVKTNLTYREDGTIQGHKVAVYDDKGTLLETSDRAESVDAVGRPAGATENGAAFVTYAYDAQGRAASATFASGDIVTMTYDTAATRALTGWGRTGAWASGTHWSFGPRGFIADEKLTIGASQYHRVYGYDDVGRLTSSSNGE